MFGCVFGPVVSDYKKQLILLSALRLRTVKEKNLSQCFSSIYNDQYILLKIRNNAQYLLRKCFEVWPQHNKSQQIHSFLLKEMQLKYQIIS